MKDSVEVDPIKVKGVIDWPEPKDKREIRQFLGFCNFYQWFIREFIQLAKPLTELTGKKAWKWSEEERRAFTKLKKSLASTPTLAIPNPECKLRMEVDAYRRDTHPTTTRQVMETYIVPIPSSK